MYIHNPILSLFMCIFSVSYPSRMVGLTHGKSHMPTSVPPGEGLDCFDPASVRHRGPGSTSLDMVLFTGACSAFF